MSSLVRYSLMMPRRFVRSFTSTNHSRPSSSSSSATNQPTQFEDTPEFKSLLRTFSKYPQATDHGMSLSQLISFYDDFAKMQLEKEEKYIHEKNLANFRAKMVETEVPLIKDCIDIIQNKVKTCKFEEEERIQLFQRYGFVVISDASVTCKRYSPKMGATVALVLRKDKPEPEVRIFLGESVSPIEAEQIPILHLLQNKSTLIVTDQRCLVSKWVHDSKTKDLDKAIVTEIDRKPGNRLMYLPSKELGLYRMCHTVAGFLSHMHVIPDKKLETEKMSICAKLDEINVDDTYPLLSQNLY